MTEIQTESFEGKTMMLTIAPPTMEDAANVGAMHLQSWIETYQNPELGIDEAWIRDTHGFVDSDAGTEYRKNLYAKIEQGDKSLFYRVAKDEAGEVVGFVMALKTEGDEPNVLDALYTLRRVQGEGLGSTLLQHALDWLGTDKPVKLEAAAHNQHAIEFYERFGFELSGKRHVHKEPMEAVEMIKA